MPVHLQISMLCGGPSAVKLVSLLVNVGFSVHLCACAYWRVKVLKNHFCLMCSVHVTWDPSGNVDLGPDITTSLNTDWIWQHSYARSHVGYHSELCFWIALREFQNKWCKQEFSAQLETSDPDVLETHLENVGIDPEVSGRFHLISALNQRKPSLHYSWSLTCAPWWWLYYSTNSVGGILEHKGEICKCPALSLSRIVLLIFSRCFLACADVLLLLHWCLWIYCSELILHFLQMLCFYFVMTVFTTVGFGQLPWKSSLPFRFILRCSSYNFLAACHEFSYVHPSRLVISCVWFHRPALSSKDLILQGT
jgi:hypothetical protein